MTAIWKCWQILGAILVNKVIKNVTNTICFPNLRMIKLISDLDNWEIRRFLKALDLFSHLYLVNCRHFFLFQRSKISYVVFSIDLDFFIKLFHNYLFFFRAFEIESILIPKTYRGRWVVTVAILGPLMTTFRRGRRKVVAGLVVVLGAAPNRHC
jgi:hypothetical protein